MKMIDLIEEFSTCSVYLHRIIFNTKDNDLKLALINNLLYEHIFTILKELGLSNKINKLRELSLELKLDELDKEVDTLKEELLNAISYIEV